MVKFLINRPVAVIVVFIALALLGTIAVMKVPVSPLPDIDIPEITVHVSKKNTAARELESAIISRLRTQLQQVSGLEDIHSETRDGYSILRLRFTYGVDINYAFIEVNEKIDLSMNDLPRDMERPRVIRASATDIPIFHINLRYKNTGTAIDASSKFIELSEFATQMVKRRLEQLPEISFVDITGMSQPEISIIPDPSIMAALGLRMDDFGRIITGYNILYGTVTAIDGGLQYNVRFASGSLITVDDIRNIRFKQDGRIFRLGDIARIGLQERDLKGSFLANNQPAVALAVIKQPDAQLSDLRSKVKELLTDLKAKYPEIQFEQTQDQTELLEISITNLKQDLILGSMLAFILMFFFLKNIRSPLLIGISLPISLLLSMLFFSIFHLSVNIISLSGLVLGVGLMIDNAIIVIDNISQYKDRNLSLSEACSKGTSEIIRPLISSVLTTCSVFLPLIFLSGIAGALFYEQAMAIAIGLAVSLVVSITLLPTLYYIFHQGKVRRLEIDFFEKYGIHFFVRIYESGFKWVFKYKRAALAIVIALVACNIFLFTILPREKLPAFKQTELVAHIDWNRNITVEENKRRASRLIASLGNSQVQSDCLIGEQQYLLSKEKQLSPSEAQVYIKINDPDSLEAIKNKIKQYVGLNYPEANLVTGAPKNIFEKVFGDDEAPLVVQLKQAGNGLLPSKEKAAMVSEGINRAFPGADITPLPVQHSLALVADPEKILLYDLSLHDIYNRLRSALHADEVASLPNGQKSMPVVVMDRVQDLDHILSTVTVPNKKGVPIPVREILKVVNEETYKTIQGGSNGIYIPLEVQSGNPLAVMDYVNQQMKATTEVEVGFTGSYFSNNKLIKEMSLVLGVAVLLLYFILAAQFESLVQPFIVLLELPISMSGALIMLYVFDSSVNLISLIGFVVMSGIIINDSILKIDAINQLRRREGYSLMDAIHTGGKRRLQSIVMTAMTTILSVAPFLFGADMGSVIQRPLSLSLIGGMVIGTPVSLYFIPLVYWFYYKKKEDRRKIKVIPVVIADPIKY